MTNGILWFKRIFIHYNQKIAFLTPESPDSNKAANWMREQYTVFEDILVKLFHSSNSTAITHDSFKSLLHFADLQKSLELFEKIIIVLLFKAKLTSDLKTIFANFVYQNRDNNLCIKAFTKICHLLSQELLTKYSQIINTENNQNFSKLVQCNTLEILFLFSEKCTKNKSPPMKKQKMSTEISKTQTRDNYLSMASPI